MIKRGHIYWASLDPAIGSEIKKTRPILVVSNDISNQASDTITVLPITSNTNDVFPFDALLPAGSGGLKTTSKAKANQIRTIDKQRLRDTPMGDAVDEQTMRRVDKAIMIHLEIN